MNESAVFPLVPLPSHPLTERFLAPSLVVAQLSDDFIILVQQSEPSVQVRHQHDIALDVNVGREQETSQSFEVLPVHVEPLESFVGTIANS